MEETQQVPSPNPMRPVPPIITYPTPQPTLTSKTPWIFITLIVTLIGVASYFGYQNYQLKQQLTVQQSSPAPEVAENDPYPIVSPSTTPNIKNNLKDYIDDKDRFIFSYPKNMIIGKSSANNVAYVETPGFNISEKSAYQIQITVMSDNPPIPAEYMKIESNTPEYDFLDKQEEKYLGGASVVTRTYKEGWETYKKYYFYTGGLGVVLNGTGYDHSVLDQVASTFKFQ